MRRGKSPYTLVFLLIVGLILGGFLGDLLAHFFKELAYYQIIGMDNPLTLNLSFIRFSFQLSLKINIGTVVGLVLAIYAYYKM
ncbi:MULTISPECIES: DUF4321 domain-containing protein [Thermoanaerobacter]|uniref:DUF4321 domain-containing protein n=2 Tax=Thermoanaerobacter TaxID=1754 RepID=D3T827_THEIA|nr:MULTISPECIES: DUF4321 domain-containing protein [Thermoanaerobacter]ADD02109.1 conserved hypothetical protein [Thermoanaerobacter italicus Ab9]MDI3529071.1 hypothetical protein [Thermoanaerobacter sp.]MDP9751351.1 hypothetical protein [Thermoanaerobacter pentosaceus]